MPGLPGSPSSGRRNFAPIPPLCRVAPAPPHHPTGLRIIIRLSTAGVVPLGSARCSGSLRAPGAGESRHVLPGQEEHPAHYGKRPRALPAPLFAGRGRRAVPGAAGSPQAAGPGLPGAAGCGRCLPPSSRCSSGRGLIYLKISLLYFYFISYCILPPLARPPPSRGSALCARCSPGRGAEARPVRGSSRLCRAGAGGAALPRSRARGGSAAGLGRTKEGGDHRSTACPRHRPRSGQGSAASAGHGRGEAQGAEKWEVGERGRGGSVENRRAP